MKIKSVKQKQALARRLVNIEDYKNGRVGSLTIEEGVDKDEFLKGKLSKAEHDVEILNSKVHTSVIIN